MKVLKGDTVKVISGKDRNKTGEVLVALPKQNKVVVKGVNIVTKHQKARGKDKPAGRIKFELPIDVSNVQVIDPATGKPTRIKYTFKDGKKVRQIGEHSEDKKKTEKTKSTSKKTKSNKSKKKTNKKTEKKSKSTKKDKATKKKSKK
ncbi:50S ribosomal protein L24 [Candidatus Dojkabacteria bacterium]|nr:50S ribosomal protein L24 [Candidatus Dojkabacteria bacterium]